MIAGLLGVPLGSYLSQRLTKKYKRIDPIICAIGLLISAPLIAGAMILITENSTIAYTLTFLGQLTLNLNWAIVADILLVKYTKLFHFHICIYIYKSFLILCSNPTSVVNEIFYVIYFAFIMLFLFCWFALLIVDP